MSKYKEYLIESDVFKRPKVIEDREAISTLLVRLILLEPGTNSSHPEMGVGLVSKYRYITNDNLSDLESNILSQIKTYLPVFQKVDIKLLMDGSKSIIIDINVDEEIYRYETIKQDDNIISLQSLL